MMRLFVVVPFRQVTLILLLMCAVFAAAAVVLVGALRFPAALWLVVIIVDALLLLVVVPVAGYVMWPNVADAEDILTGEPWAHWTYGEQEWRAANRLESRRELGIALIPGLLAIAGLVTADIGFNVKGGSQWAGIGVALAVVGAIIVLVLGGTGTGVVGRLRSRGEVYINRHGVYRRPGGYIPFTGAGQRLDTVTLVSDRYLAFTLVGQRRRPAEVTRVLVPDGQLDRARLVTHWFGTYLRDG